MSRDGTAWDVIVVGGGPAGSTLAWDLARRGGRVLLLEARAFPRTKLCAGWVTRQVWHDLELSPDDYPHTLQPFSEASIEVGGRRLSTRWDCVASYGVIRAEFDAHLLDRAAAAGAHVETGCRVRALVRDGSSMSITTEDGRTREARWVVGAGGHGCPVARTLGAATGPETIVVTRESETRVGRERILGLPTRAGTPELVAEPDFRGYGWFFSKGDHLNIGVGCIGEGRELHQRTDRLIARLREDGRLPPDLELAPFRGHAYAVRLGSPRAVAGPGFLLVGDAAGLAQGMSGEGIGPAVRSARMGAEALDGTEDQTVARYRAGLRTEFGVGEPNWLGRLLPYVPARALESTAALVCKTGWLRRRVLFEGAFGLG